MIRVVNLDRLVCYPYRSEPDRQTDRKGGSDDLHSYGPQCVRCWRAVNRRDLIPGGEVNGTIEDPLWLTALPLPLCPEGGRQCGSSRICDWANPVNSYQTQQQLSRDTSLLPQVDFWCHVFPLKKINIFFPSVYVCVCVFCGGYN